jgi:hypothetical protein
LGLGNCRFTIEDCRLKNEGAGTVRTLETKIRSIRPIRGSQGRSHGIRPTLGWGAESRWDWGIVDLRLKIADCRLLIADFKER